MKIHWSDEAMKKFDETIDYLLREWSIAEAIKYQENLDRTLKVIQLNVGIGRVSLIHNCRKFLIDKNNSIIYQVDLDLIYVVALVDNKTDHPY